MKVQSIDILCDMEDEDIYDSNMDVAVKLEDGHTYTLVVGTPKNLLTMMEYEQSDFLSPGDPIIIVKKLTKEVIQKAVQAYAEDEAYCLKFYAAKLDVKTLNVLKDRSIARFDYIDHLLEGGESIDIENYDLINFNINNDSNKNFD